MQAATDCRDRGRRRGAAVARHGCGGCCACRAAASRWVCAARRGSRRRGDRPEDRRLGEEATSMSQVEPGVEIDEEVFEPGDSHFTVIRLSLTAALGGFLFGYDSSVINGAVAAITAHFSASAGVLGFTVSSALLGAAAGALGCGRGAERYGRLPAMRAAAVLFLICLLYT